MREFLKWNPHKSADPLFSFARAPNQQEFVDSRRDGNRAAQQDDSGAPWRGRVPGEMRRHRTTILAHQHSAGVSRDPQDVGVAKSLKLRVGRSPNIDFMSGAPQAANDAPVEISVGLESDSRTEFAVKPATQRSDYRLLAKLGM